MAERIRETRERVVENDALDTVERPVRQTEVVHDEPTGDTAARIVYYITSIVLTILAIRFVLSMLGANRGNAFAGLIYGLSYPFVAPFFGLFGYQMQYGVSRFELETLVAIAVYALVGYGIARMLSSRHDRV